jgi:hypothetical protein
MNHDIVLIFKIKVYVLLNKMKEIWKVSPQGIKLGCQHLNQAKEGNRKLAFTLSKASQISRAISFTILTKVNLPNILTRIRNIFSCIKV